MTITLKIKSSIPRKRLPPVLYCALSATKTGGRIIQQRSQNMFTDSVEGLANILALICAILLTPSIDDVTGQWATQAFVKVYGTELSDLFRLVWFLVVGAGVFYLSRAGIALALMMISGWAVFRFGLIA